MVCVCVGGGGGRVGGGRGGVQNFDVNRHLLSSWPIDASFITKSVIVPEKSIVFTFSRTKA